MSGDWFERLVFKSLNKTNLIEKNIICCYDSTEVQLCGHPSIHIQKLLMVKYFMKHNSLTLLSHLASLFIKVEVFLTI